MKKLKKYWAILRTSAQRAIAYRMNFIISIGITFVGFFATFYFWQCVYIGRENVASYSWGDMKTYLFVSFISGTFLSWYAESGLSKKILDGTVEMDLVKPLSFQFSRLFESLGSTVFEILVVVILAVPVTLIFAIPLSAKIFSWLLFIISMVLSVFCKFGIIYIFSMFCFHTTSHVGVSWSRQAITNLLSGAVIPLSFLPGPIQNFLGVLPFRYIVDIPANIFMGRYSTAEALALLGIGVLWTVLLFIVGKLLYSAFIRKVTINGG